jgi:hypothetical protein
LADSLAETFCRALLQSISGEAASGEGSSGEQAERPINAFSWFIYTSITFIFASISSGGMRSSTSKGG